MRPRQATTNRGVGAANPAPKPDRLVAVDALRTIAIFFIVIIHTAPFATAASPIGSALDLGTVLNQVSRFAVPFFFVVSGYFWAARIAAGQDPWNRSTGIIKRLGVLFLAWSIIYLLPFNPYGDLDYGVLGPLKRIYWNAREVIRHPVRAMWEGTKVHLWFLPALMSCVAISALALKYVHSRWLVLIAICLFVIGLAGKAYSGTPVGFRFDFDARNGPFFGLIFFVTGYQLQRTTHRGHWLGLGIAMTGFGLLATFAELSMLNRLWGVGMEQDFVLSTYFYGVGVSLVALANPSWLRSEELAAAGPLVLGIYASHLVVVEMLQPLTRIWRYELAWSLAQPLLVFLVACGLAWILSRFSPTRSLVM